MVLHCAYNVLYCTRGWCNDYMAAGTFLAQSLQADQYPSLTLELAKLNS